MNDLEIAITKLTGTNTDILEKLKTIKTAIDSADGHLLLKAHDEINNLYDKRAKEMAGLVKLRSYIVFSKSADKLFKKNSKVLNRSIDIYQIENVISLDKILEILQLFPDEKTFLEELEKDFIGVSNKVWYNYYIAEKNNEDDARDATIVSEIGENGENINEVFDAVRNDPALPESDRIPSEQKLLNSEYAIQVILNKNMKARLLTLAPAAFTMYCQYYFNEFWYKRISEYEDLKSKITVKDKELKDIEKIVKEIMPAKTIAESVKKLKVELFDLEGKKKDTERDIKSEEKNRDFILGQIEVMRKKAIKELEPEPTKPEQIDPEKMTLKQRLEAAKR